MTDDNEQGSGTSAGAVVTGVAGLGAATYGTDRYLSRDHVAKAWKADAAAPQKVATDVKATLDKAGNEAFKTQAENINKFNGIKDPAAVALQKSTGPTAIKPIKAPELLKGKLSGKATPPPPPTPAVTKINYTTAAEKTALHVEGARGPIKIDLSKTPKNVPTGAITGDKIKAGFDASKGNVGGAEKALTTELRSQSGMKKFGQGLMHGSTKQQLVAAGVVAGIGVVAYGIGSKVFPSHARRVERERAAQQGMERT